MRRSIWRKNHAVTRQLHLLVSHWPSTARLLHDDIALGINNVDSDRQPRRFVCRPEVEERIEVALATVPRCRELNDAIAEVLHPGKEGKARDGFDLVVQFLDVTYEGVETRISGGDCRTSWGHGRNQGGMNPIVLPTCSGNSDVDPLALTRTQ